MRRTAHSSCAVCCASHCTGLRYRPLSARSVFGALSRECAADLTHVRRTAHQWYTPPTRGFVASGGGGAAAAHRPSVNALMRAVTTQPMQNKCTCAAAWCRPACKQRSAAHDDTNTIRAFAAATVKRREPWAAACVQRVCGDERVPARGNGETGRPTRRQRRRAPRTAAHSAAPVSLPSASQSVGHL